MIGPGKYDEVAIELQQQLQASAALVVIIQGLNGSGVACKGTPAALRALPKILRTISTALQKDLKGLSALEASADKQPHDAGLEVAQLTYHKAGAPEPLGRIGLDVLLAGAPRCPHPGCSVDHDSISLRAKCHPDAGCQAVYVKGGKVLLICRSCETVVTTLKLAD